MRPLARLEVNKQSEYSYYSDYDSESDRHNTEK